MNVTAVSSSATPGSVAPAPRSAAGRGASASSAAEQPSADEQRIVAQLQQRDREVRTHEMTHIAAGAGLVRGGATYSFERGPDGKLYAVGGEVSIDTSPASTPEQTIERARQIRSAALAPADPSAQDRQVAAAASLMENQARRELAASKREEDADATSAVQQNPDRENRGRTLSITLEPDRVGEVIDTFA